MRQMFIIAFILVMFAALSGCGETISGVGKDLDRVGRGVSTVFFRQ